GWAEFDAAMAQKMNAMAGKEVVLLTQTLASPSTYKLIADFTEKYPNVRHVEYDAVSCSDAVDAFQSQYGMRALPDYDFSKAEVIVSIGADFLGDWQGGGYSSSYAKSRIPKNGKMSRHIQFESNLSLAGAKADKRVPVTPSQQMQVLKAIAGGGSTSGLPENVAQAVSSAKAQLQRAGSKGILITDLPGIEAQNLALQFNKDSEVMDANAPKLIRQGSNAAVNAVVNGVMSGTIKGLITMGVDPVYSLPNGSAFAEAYQNLEFSLAFSMRNDATAELAQMVAATPHYLESWGDYQLKSGFFSLSQPTIRPLSNTRQFQECLLRWTGGTQTYYDYLKDTWNTAVLDGKTWNQALHDGFAKSSKGVFFASTAGYGSGVLESSSSDGAMATFQENAGGFELTLYTKTALGDGQQANNPWLQELPDPITRTTWDNYVTMSKADADELGVVNKIVANGALDGSYVSITMNNVTLEKVPVIIQPGQAKGSIGLA